MYTQIHLFPLGSYLVVWALSHLSEHIQGISRGLWNLDGRTSRVSTWYAPGSPPFKAFRSPEVPGDLNYYCALLDRLMGTTATSTKALGFLLGCAKQSPITSML
ncbi:hypothetical protein EDD16DRAFT_1646093 [Pisolithus croceorrhizus]|nr:hypothetical protein EDD16DRAFT_1646093 [Pisolithus croceorrhizus]